MENDGIRRARVWSGPLRVIHWTLGSTVLLTLATGWQMRHGLCSNIDQLLAVHTSAGAVLGVALVSRLYLLFFGTGPERWQDFIPRGPQLLAAHEVLLFYLSAGRRALPPYYAHNPLWGTAYLFLILILSLQLASGALLYLGYGPVLQGYSLLDLHRMVYVFIGLFSLLHVMAAFLHDFKGSGCEISAMVNGSKIFILRQPKLDVSAVVRRIPIRVVGKKD